MSANIAERAYNALIAGGVDARLATRHEGRCAEPYCVVYEGPVQPQGKTLCTRHVLVDILAPAAKPQLLAPLAGEVQTAMRASAGMFWENTGPVTALDEYKAVAATMDFSALCGLEE